MQCEYCGDACTFCSPRYGCLESFKVDHGFRRLEASNYPAGTSLFSDATPSSQFWTSFPCKDSRCDKCQNADNISGVSPSKFPICDSCFQYVNFYPLAKQQALNCSLCTNSAIKNCNTCDPDRPQNCASCNSGYYIGPTNITCVQCPTSVFTTGCFRCNQTQCLECISGYVLSGGTCLKCDLSEFNQEYFLEPARCTACQPTDTKACQYCSTGFLGSISNPTKCQLKCDDGQYPLVTFGTVNFNENVILSTQCQSCDSSCLTCARGTSKDCLTCKLTDYLTILNITEQSGSCNARLNSNTAISYDIFVSPQDNGFPTTSINLTTIGSYNNPFWDLEFALQRAQELAVQYSSSVIVTVNIYLFTGDHYIIRNRADTQLIYYPTNFKANGNLNYKLNIQPLPCSYTAEQNVNYVCDDGVITIYNKNRELFTIDVPVSLAMTNIKIDSLDSILFGLTDDISDNCISQRSQCCQIVNNSIKSIDGSTVCETALDNYLSSDESKCLQNTPRALFKMMLNSEKEVTAPTQVTLVNVEITNIFYAINSIVSFTPIWGKVTIKNSNFNQLNMCGSVIKSYYQDIGKPDILGSVNYLYFNDRLRNLTDSIINQPPVYNSNPASQTCTDTTCFSISIASSKFTKIPFLSSNIDSYQLVSESNGMSHIGYVLNLKDFAGPVSITDSAFIQNKVPFTTCQPTIPEQSRSINNFKQLYSSSSEFDKVQQHSLISIQGMSGPLTITNNNFTQNVMMSGLIDIYRSSATSSTSTKIQSNVFKSNGAIRNNNIMTLKQCGFTTISQNTFSLNAGCEETGVMQVQCIGNSFEQDSTFNDYILQDESTPTAASSVTLTSNYYYGNLVGKDKHVLSVEGFQTVQQSLDQFYNNENYLPQSFNQISPIAALLSSKPTAVTTLDNYEYKAKSILKIASSSTTNILNIYFYQNWIADHQSLTSDYQSNALLLQDLTGLLQLNNITFDYHQGVQTSLYAGLTSKGIRSQLITLKNVDLSQFVFKQITFYRNNLYLSPSDIDVVMPCLFKLTHEQISSIKLENLVVNNTNNINSQYSVYLQLEQFQMSTFKIISNNGTTIVLIDLVSDSTNAFLIQNGEVKSNKVAQGSVFVIQESSEFKFINADTKPTSTKPKNPKFTFQLVKFQSNVLYGDIGVTSCVHTVKKIERTYTWLSVKIQSCKFISNTGKLTQALYFADSMVSWLIIDSLQFNVTSSNTIRGSQAQVLYKNDDSYLSVTNSQFNCLLAYDSTIIMQYSLSDVESRPSLFRIYDPSSTVRLDQLELNNTDSPGTLDGSTFKNLFSGNTYQSCNQVNKGSIFYLESGAQVNDYGSSYQDNSALEGGLAYLDGDSTYLTIDTASVIRRNYAYNGAVVYVTNGATAHITESTITFSTAYEGCIAYLIYRGRLVFIDSSAISNTAMKQGMISSFAGSQFWIDTVKFTSCTGNYQAAIISIENGREQYYLVDGSIDLAFGVNNYLRNYINNCVITKSITNVRGRLIQISDASLYINNTSFEQNLVANLDNQGITVFGGELTIVDSNFTGTTTKSFYSTIFQQNLQAINGAFVSAYGISAVTVSGSIFQFGRAQQGGCIILIGSVIASFTDTKFNKCAAMEGGAIYADAFDSLTIDSCQFDDNIAYQGNGQNIYAIGGINLFLITSSSFTSYQNSLYVSSSFISIDRTNFTGGPNPISGLGLTNGGGIYIKNALQLFISKCRFDSLQAINGGAIYYNGESSDELFGLQKLAGSQMTQKILITSTTFTKCSALINGGTIYLQDPSYFQILNSNFLQSTAQQNGGAIYFYCQPLEIAQQDRKPVQCELNLGTIIFQNCTANIGGGLWWNFNEPTITGNQTIGLVVGAQSTSKYKSLTFVNCTAKAYGPQIAAPAQELVQISNATYQNYYNQSGPRRQELLRQSYRLNSTSLKPLLTQFTFAGVQSGGDIPATWFGLIDKYGQIVQTNSGGQIKYNLKDVSHFEGELFSTQILGKMEFYSTFGVYETSNMGVLSQPGININLTISVNAVDIRVPTTRKYLSQYMNNKNITMPSQYEIKVLMKVRSCILGEGLKDTGACFTCPSGSYLLDVPTTPQECQICQVEKSICLGGSDIGPLPGWWRKSKYTYTFVVCKVEEACLGKIVQLSQNEPGNAVGLCAIEKGYYGVLCSACLPGFKRSDIYSCTKCTPYEPYYTALAFTIIVIGLCFLIKSTIDGAASANNTHSVFNKILMNHMQMILITASFNMDWPQVVIQIFNLAAPIKQITSSLTSFDCYMDNRDPKSIDPYNFYADPHEIRIVYIKLFIMAVMPIFIVIICYVSWYVVLRIQKKIHEHQTRFVASVILIIFLVHPSITQSMIDIFNCQEIDGDLRLVVDMQIICYTGLHSYLAWGLALPCLILWGIGIPLVVLLMMRKESDKLDTVAVKQKFGFLFNGYKRHNYFWEIVIMYRKILCIFIAVFLNRVGIIVQALVLLIVLVIFLQANASNRPFSERALNDIEALSLATQIVTIYCGIFFISAKDPNTSSFDPNKDFVLSETGKLVFFGVIAVCNVAFLVLWLTKFIVVIKVLIKDSYPRLYIIFFLCGRKDKMALETAKRARDTKKEAIIESIEAVNLMMTKMKGMYSNNVFYEDHNRFLRLLYYIESERQQICLTEKRHNYYIQGAMSRHRRFDPEIVKEAQNKWEIEIESNFMGKPQSKIQRGLSKLSSFIKLQPTTPLSKIHIEKRQYSQQLDQSSQDLKSQFQSQKNDISRSGQDILELDERDFDVQLPQETKKKQQSKKLKRKANQADLTAVYLNSRNAAVALKSEVKSHIRAANVSKIDGSIKKLELPDYLVGFNDIYQKSERDALQVVPQLKTSDSFQEKLHIMRKLTDRINDLTESPSKSPQKKTESQKTGISHMGETDQQPPTMMEAESRTARDSADLKPYHESEYNNEELRNKQQDPSKIPVREVVLTKGDGGQAAPQVEIAHSQIRKRPPKEVRHELIGNEVHLINKAVADDLDENLIITILDEDGQYVPKQIKQNRLSIKQQLQSQQSQPTQVIVPGKQENVSKNEITESFRTDPSMKEFDIMQGEPDMQNEDLYGYNKLTEERKKQEVTPTIMGDGLLNQNQPNFHPSVRPGIIFDSSVSRRSELEDFSGKNSDQEDQSARQLIKPTFQLGNLTDRSRN